MESINVSILPVSVIIGIADAMDIILIETFAADGCFDGYNQTDECIRRLN